MSILWHRYAAPYLRQLGLYPAEFKRINGNQFIGRSRMKRGDFQTLLITLN